MSETFKCYWMMCIIRLIQIIGVLPCRIHTTKKRIINPSFPEECDAADRKPRMKDENSKLTNNVAKRRTESSLKTSPTQLDASFSNLHPARMTLVYSPIMVPVCIFYRMVYLISVYYYYILVDEFYDDYNDSIKNLLSIMICKVFILFSIGVLCAPLKFKRNLYLLDAILAHQHIFHESINTKSLRFWDCHMKIFAVFIVIAVTTSITPIIKFGSYGALILALLFFYFYGGILLSGLAFRGHCLLLLVKLSQIQKCINNDSLNMIDIREKIREVNTTSRISSCFIIIYIFLFINNIFIREAV